MEPQGTGSSGSSEQGTKETKEESGNREQAGDAGAAANAAPETTAPPAPIAAPVEAAAPIAPAAAAPVTLAPETAGYRAPPATISDALPVVEGGEADREMRRISRRSFLWAGVAVVGVLGGRHWLNTRRQESGIPWPLRRTLEINEQITRDYFRTARLSPTFPRAMASEPKQNGDYGLDGDVAPDWKLSLAGLPDADEPLKITLEDLKKLPKTEIVTELKCIEGWSKIVHWAGVRFTDVIAHYWPVADHPLSEMPQYVAMETPDGAYYVGLDRESAMHPQTLLCYEMNGAALAPEHGAPLRLAIPVKYGIKNIKRIGTIRLTDARPKDYWAEQGYDWYAGH